jgi:hypothetical protein
MSFFMKSRNVGSSSTTATRRVLRAGVALTGSDMLETNDMGNHFDKKFLASWFAEDASSAG